MTLGKLKKVDLRAAWKHEAADFTNWLAEEENLDLLGDELGIEMDLVQTEAAVGNFNVDILAQEEDSEKKIIIENQLEATNHDHLGKIIVYASGYDAGTVIWVVKDVREEHRQAIDWLNDHTDKSIQFFLIKIELWQIGGSDFAPKFEIISKPNEWAREIKKSADKRDPSPVQLKQLKFWESFKEFLKNKNSKLRPQKSQPIHWNNISVGKTGIKISLTINSRDNLFGVEMYIRDDKDLYKRLEAQKAEIEAELGEKPEWMALPDKKASRIKVSYPGDLEDEDKWGGYFQWMQREAEKFYRVFPKHIKGP